MKPGEADINRLIQNRDVESTRGAGATTKDFNSSQSYKKILTGA